MEFWCFVRGFLVWISSNNCRGVSHTPWRGRMRYFFCRWMVFNMLSECILAAMKGVCNTPLHLFGCNIRPWNSLFSGFAYMQNHSFCQVSHFACVQSAFGANGSDGWVLQWTYRKMVSLVLFLSKCQQRFGRFQWALDKNRPDDRSICARMEGGYRASRCKMSAKMSGLRSEWQIFWKKRLTLQPEI